MSDDWPSLDYDRWASTCDTLHGHTQVLGKLAAKLAPPAPQLQHAALSLTTRGWETLPLPAPNGSGAFAVALDLRHHEALVEISTGETERIRLTPDRSIGSVTRDLLAAVHQLAGPVEFDMTPQEVPWTTSLDEDEAHATYDVAAVETYFAMATRAALVLAAYRAPFSGRNTPVNAWWGSFDLAVSMFSGRPAQPASDDFIGRNAMTAQEIAVGWWPGDPSYPKAAFYAYAYPAPPGFGTWPYSPSAARWEDTLGEYVLDWDAIRADPDPHASALEFARSAFEHSCTLAGWDPVLAASGEGRRPPLT